MDRTALYDKLAASGARMGSHGGVETALSYGDTRAEFLELRRGCAVYDLGWRAVFHISGADRTRWLNGMITNNIRDLAPGYGNYNFVLNSQGRVQGDLYVYNLEDYLLATTEREQVARLMQLLQRYIIMDKVELADRSAESSAIGVQGPKACELVQKAGFAADLGPMQVARITWQNVPLMLTHLVEGKFSRYEIGCVPEHAASVWDALLAAGGRPAGTEALEQFRVAAGIPRFGQDIHDRDLPQETGQQQALNFNKGCYIGQEIVERIRSRGQVHRVLTGFVIDGAPPELGAKATLEGREVGEITSALRVPSGEGDKTLALGYIRREASKPGMIVDVAGSEAKVSELPFSDAISGFGRDYS